MNSTNSSNSLFISRTYISSTAYQRSFDDTLRRFTKSIGHHDEHLSFESNVKLFPDHRKPPTVLIPYTVPSYLVSIRSECVPTSPQFDIHTSPSSVPLSESVREIRVSFHKRYRFGGNQVANKTGCSLDCSSPNPISRSSSYFTSSLKYRKQSSCLSPSFNIRRVYIYIILHLNLVTVSFLFCRLAHAERMVFCASPYFRWTTEVSTNHELAISCWSSKHRQPPTY